jgi:hypothetical protein
MEHLAEIYRDIEIQTNENGETELGFKTKKYARELVKLTSRMSVIYRDERTRYSMQFIADILRKISDEGHISVADLYEKPESEIIEIIEKSNYAKVLIPGAKQNKLRRAKKSQKIPITSTIQPKFVISIHYLRANVSQNNAK